MNAIILRGYGRLVQAGVNIGKSLQSFLMSGSLFQDGLILSHGLAELILFEVASSPVEMFV